MKRNSVNVFKALGDPNRVRVLKMLEGGDLCVCEVREILDLSTSTVSKHLSILRAADLIIDSKDGKWVNYGLNTHSANPLVQSVLELCKRSFEDDETIRGDRRKAAQTDRNKICCAP